MFAPVTINNYSEKVHGCKNIGCVSYYNNNSINDAFYNTLLYVPYVNTREFRSGRHASCMHAEGCATCEVYFAICFAVCVFVFFIRSLRTERASRRHGKKIGQQKARVVSYWREEEKQAHENHTQQLQPVLR